MDEGSRIGRLRVVAFAGLLVFIGVGCVSRAPSLRSEVTSEASIVSTSTQQASLAASTGQDCRDLEALSPAEIDKLLFQAVGEDVQMLVSSALREKESEGWGVRLLCLRPSLREIYLSFLNVNGSIRPQLYAASPDDPSPTGTASMLAMMTWPELSATTGTSLMLRSFYSHPVGIRGNGDVDTFREISVRDGIHGRVDTGTLTADVHFIPGVQTVVKDICTMDLYADDAPDQNHRCYPNK